MTHNAKYARSNWLVEAGAKAEKRLRELEAFDPTLLGPAARILLERSECSHPFHVQATVEGTYRCRDCGELIDGDVGA